MPMGMSGMQKGVISMIQTNYPQRYITFQKDMERAEYVVEEYHGRNFYVGPAIIIEAGELQEVIRATAINLQWDTMGKNGLVVYPR